MIFEGFTTIFTHPFWGDIWSGMVEQLAAAGFRPVLNMLEAEPSSGTLDLTHFSLSAAAGRIVLGIASPELLNQVHKSVHMISLGKGTASSEIMDYLGLMNRKRILS